MSDDEESPSEVVSTPQPRPRPQGMVRVRYEGSMLPPVEQMAGFEKLLPGATDRFFKIVESDVGSIVNHRKAQASFLLRGQIFTFIVILIVLGIAVFCVVKDATGAAAAIATGVIGGGALLALYARGRKGPPKS